MYVHRGRERLEKTEEAALAALMERLIEEREVRRFLCGMEQGLELAFGETAAQLRDSKYPFITLESVIPYEEQARSGASPSGTDTTTWLQDATESGCWSGAMSGAVLCSGTVIS